VPDLIRHPQGRIAEQIRMVGETPIFTSIIVATELRYGAAKKGSARLSMQVEKVQGALDVLPFEAPADTAYGLLRSRLEQTGTLIGGSDLLIAAQAIALGCTIVTERARICPRRGTAARNWLRRD
jgi:tRNA(fMet)-specific endonuclease VapC